MYFPNSKIHPSVVRAQPSLKAKNPIYAADITHQMFVDRVNRFKEGLDERLEWQITFEDIFGNRLNLLDETEFLEALTLHEHDEDF